GRIVHGIFRPTDNLTATVRAGRESVVSAESRQRAHRSVLPDESKVNVTCAGCSRIERRAAPRFAQWIRRGGLGDAGDDAGVTFYRPRDCTIRSAERAQIGERAISPESGVPALISSKIR